MSKEFTLADPGEGLSEAEILEIHVSAGDRVADGDTVLTVETDKANTDIPAPFSGTIEEIRVSEGDTAEVGDVLMTYDEGADESGSGEPAGRDEHPSGSEDQTQSGHTDKTDQGSDDGHPAHEKNVEMGDIEDDGDSADDGQTQRASERPEPPDQKGSQKRESREPVPASPNTRRLAREYNVELDDIEPSGRHGRVTAEDVEAAAQAPAGEQHETKKASQRAAVLIPGGGQAPALPDFSQWGETERVPLRSIRRATAQNMARAWGQIPHVYHQDIADVTELERFRHEHEDAAEVDGGKFTLTVLVMKALASALKQYPRFNASLDVDHQEIVLKHYCHIGLAVATDRGLLVPVIRDVADKNLIELSTEAADIARKARNGEIQRADMQGASTTVTNPGPLGGSSLTPLINHPQVAILGMAQTRLEPVVHGGFDDYEIKPRLRLPLVLGFDHRVNDGADAAKFVTHLANTLADPESLLLNL